ncbi:MAG: hypothetical protein GY929_11410 [Actinomycetia bacterium]|nr:hypothetical protein [Actinomycetes bacterium]
MERELGPDGLPRMIDALVRSGREVVATVVRDGVVTLDRIESAAELPTGWRDEQEPGRYRAQPTESPSYFQFAASAQPWKRFLHEEPTLLIRTRRTGDGLQLTEPAGDRPALAFVGIRSCDLEATRRLDAVLAADPAYQRRRAGLVVIAVACTAPAATCFCASVGTGPRPGHEADVVLTEIDDGHLLASAHTDFGRNLLDESGANERADPEQVGRAHELVEACAQVQARHLDPDDLARAAAHPDDKGWAEVANRCLTCGNCTMVCPTCFCTAIEDRTSIADDSAERWQRWDSCFSLDFSYVHGGPVRPSASSRYRQWYLHKLVTWHDQFGSSGCVGCGRCITWCPTGIDMTEAVVR